MSKLAYDSETKTIIRIMRNEAILWTKYSRYNDNSYCITGGVIALVCLVSPNKEQIPVLWVMGHWLVEMLQVTREKRKLFNGEINNWM